MRVLLELLMFWCSNLTALFSMITEKSFFLWIILLFYHSWEFITLLYIMYAKDKGSINFLTRVNAILNKIYHIHICNTLIQIAFTLVKNLWTPCPWRTLCTAMLWIPVNNRTTIWFILWNTKLHLKELERDTVFYKTW